MRLVRYLLLVSVVVMVSGCLTQPVSNPPAQNGSGDFSIDRPRDVVVLNDASTNRSITIYIQNETTRGDDFRGPSEISHNRVVTGGERYRLDEVGREGELYYVYAATGGGSNRTSQRIYRWEIESDVGDLVISITDGGEVEITAQTA